jgi:uncharacterized protein (TIGR03083 family)
MDDREPARLLDAVWTSLDELLSGLSTDDWDRSTDCPGWTVKDQVSHIIGTESMLLGRPAPPPVEGPPARNPMGQVNEGWVAERRGRKPAEVLAEFREVTAARRQALAAMTDEDWGRLTDSPIGQAPYGEFMRVRVMDQWVHQQDIRRAVDRPGDLGGPVAEAALGRFTGSLGFIIGKRAGAAEGTSVVVHLEAPAAPAEPAAQTGPMEQTLAVIVTDGRAKPSPAPEHPTVTLTMTPETYSCLSAGRWTADEVLSDGRVQVDGDKDLAERILAGMAIIP